MIPRKLQLKNFLSYGSETQSLDFEPYHMICLSGKNGHGKSALLDALTWVLWGQARKVAGTSKADDGLIRLNQTHMMVCFDFTCNGTTYRVRREYTLHQNKAMSHLDFGIVNPETQQLQSLTDKTIRGTQEKINSCLGLDYDAFINSAFLRQGQSNEFSKRSARERKEILASILGLERYELLRRKALDALRIAQQERDNLTAQQASILQEINTKSTIIEQLNTVQNQLHEITQQETETCNEYQKIDGALNETMQQKTALQTQQALYDQAQRARKEYATALIERITQWRSVHRQHHRVKDHATAYQAYTDIEQQIQTLQPQLTLFRQTQTTVITTKEQLNKTKEQLVLHHTNNQKSLIAEQAKLQSTLAHQATQLQELQKTITKESAELAALRLTIAHTTAQLAQYDTILAQQTAIEAQFERRKQTFHRWTEQGKTLQAHISELEEKKIQLLKTSCSSCPLCLQNLSETTRELVIASFEQQHKTATRYIKRLSTFVPLLKQVLFEQHAALKAQAAAAQEREITRNRCIDFQQNYTKKETLIVELKQQVEQQTATYNYTQTLLEKIKQSLAALGSLEQLIERDEIYRNLSQQLEQQQITLKQLETVEQNHQALTDKLKTLDNERKQYEKLMHDIALQQERSQEIKKISQSMSRVEHELAKRATSLQDAPRIEKAIAQLQQQKYHYEQTRNTLLNKKEAVAHSRGALEHQKNLLEKKELDLQKFQERLTTLDRAINDYQAINQALGKDGIQALLIEEALPDIEQEANIILGKLTDNQAHIIIESLRDLKSGSTKETLDIKISDSLGIRPYEMFSGGEAFRIDFALRIAISKLLARRAGATMQLLVIDEGFGSQDEEGLAHIMDMLYKIQDSFAKIIIVSHLPMLKEQFPVHFMVQKTPQGSTINIVQNG
jgi:exonuclease SbcC